MKSEILLVGLALSLATRGDVEWVRVAAADSRAEAKAAADVVCTGTNDELSVQRALALCASVGKNLYLFDGVYHFDAFHAFGDGGPRASVVLPIMRRELVIRGQSPHSRTTNGVENGAVIRLTKNAWGTSGEGVPDVIRGEWTKRGINNCSGLRLTDVGIYVADAQHPVRALDLRRTDSVQVESVYLVALGDRVFAGQRYPYADPPLEVPVLDSIGLTMTDGSNHRKSHYAFVLAVGFGQGIQVGGEHVVCDTCAATFGLYGWTFGNYEYNCGFNHPITLINCCDEQNVNLPLFNRCGDDGGAKLGRQEVTMISFNCERVADHAPGKKLGDLMREVIPGTWRGNISFTRQPRWSAINSVDEPIWAEDGSGRGFRTVNNAHKPACTTDERKSYYPQYMQQVFDTDLNKLLICIDPAKRRWVDAAGKEVR